MTDETTTGPALTPEEWDHVLNGYPWLDSGARGTARERARDLASDAAQEGKLHRAAALALYGQPYGFTAEDVAVIRAEADAWRWGSEVEQERAPDAVATMERLYSLADRIAALLPKLP